MDFSPNFRAYSIFRILLASIILLLTGCGGGNNSSPAQEAQTLSFSVVGPSNLVVGDVQTNIASGQGTGVVTYTSNDTGVATVDSAGLIKTVGKGNAIIIATKAADSRYLSAQASYSIHVSAIAQTLTFQQTQSIDAKVDDKLSNPAAAPGTGAITYTSNNTNVAIVDNSGEVTVVGIGVATITANKEADSKYLAATSNYTLKASGLNQNISFERKGPLTAETDGQLVNPATGQGIGSVSYESNNVTIATVNNLGQVTILKPGTVLITATISGDNKYIAASATYTINASKGHQVITYKNSGDFFLIVGSIISSNASTKGNGLVTYTSSNETVATIDKDGVIHALNSGTATIHTNIAEDENYLAATADINVNVAPAPQTLTFAQPGPITTALNGTVQNIAHGEGTGAITYSSDNSSIASVNSNGVVTIAGVGAVTISATKAADSKYLEAIASYKIYTAVPMSAWIGSQDTLINLPATVNGFTLQSSISNTCDLNNFLNCSFEQLNIVNSSAIVDTSANLTRVGYFLLANSTQKAALTLDSNSVVTTSPSRVRAEIVEYNNKLFLIGGYHFDNSTAEYQFLNDLWSSGDGINWNQENTSAGFTGRTGHQVVSFNNQLWLIGGRDSQSNLLNDIWSSTDGITWSQQVSNAPFSPRWNHQVISFAGQLWLIGGNDGQYKNDIWSSTDGVTWIQRSINASFSARATHQLAIFNNQLWLIGGSVGPSISPSNLRNDVWASSDGVTWVQKTPNAAFSPREQHQVTAFNGKLWMIGGYAGIYLAENTGLNDSWSSSDGITWNLEILHAAFSKREYPKVTIHNNKLLLVHGLDSNNSDQNDAWTSDDGINWRKGFSGTFIFK